jgi:hypothetical protein
MLLGVGPFGVSLGFEPPNVFRSAFDPFWQELWLALAFGLQCEVEENLSFLLFHIEIRRNYNQTTAGIQS